MNYKSNNQENSIAIFMHINFKKFICIFNVIYLHINIVHKYFLDLLYTSKYLQIPQKQVIIFI